MHCHFDAIGTWDSSIVTTKGLVSVLSLPTPPKLRTELRLESLEKVASEGWVIVAMAASWPG